MKNIVCALLMWLVSFGASASPILFPTDGDINIFNISNLLANGATDPVLFALVAAGEDPNTTARAPLNFDVFTSQVFDITESTVTYAEVAPELGGGFAFSTVAATVILPTAEFELAWFDGFTDEVNTPDWHTASVWEQTGDTSFNVVFNPHPGSATQAGLIVSDVGTFDLPPQGVPIDTAPPAAVPVPAAVWLFGSGLLGLAGVARIKG